MALLLQAAIVRVAALVSWRSQSRIDGARVARPVVRTDCRTIAIRALTQAGRCELAVGEVAIAEVAHLASAERRQTRDEDKLFVRWKLHHLARRQQRPRGFLAADHDMRQPRGEPVPGKVAHCALLRSEEQ